jgi:hypothetical protein
MNSIMNTVTSYLVGRTCQDFRLIEDGTLILYLDGSGAYQPPAEACFWINCAWRVRQDEQILIGSLDDPVRILPILKSLIKEIISGVQIDNHTRDVTLSCHSGLLIESFCYMTDGENWELRKSDGCRYGVGADLKPFELRMTSTDSNGE